MLPHVMVLASLQGFFHDIRASYAVRRYMYQHHDHHHRRVYTCGTCMVQVGVDRHNQVMSMSIIDYIRQYTLDKKMETWVKGSGILGGNGKVNAFCIHRIVCAM